MNPRQRTEHRNAGDLTAAWIGSRITVQTMGGPVSGVLCDYQQAGDTIALFVSGHVITAWPSTTVTRGLLDVMGGAA